jgi:hypothetical protein
MREFVIRRIVGIGVVIGLSGPVGCIKEEDPRPFSTGDSCYPGDIEDCVCADSSLSVVGTRACPKSRQFRDSPCVCEKSSSTGGGSGK